MQWRLLGSVVCVCVCVCVCVRCVCPLHQVCVSRTTERRLVQPDNADVFVLTVPDKIQCPLTSLIAACCLGCCPFVAYIHRVWGGGQGGYHTASVCFVGDDVLGIVYARLDPWCSGPSLEEVGDVSETSHQRCSLMERDDLGEPKLQWAQSTNR